MVTVWGAAGGYGSGLAAGFIETGRIDQAHRAGLEGAKSGLRTGAIAGGTMAVVEAKKGGYNLWSGKENLNRRRVTLGYYEDYLLQAEKNNTDKFHLDLEKTPMTDKQLWRANKRFLRYHIWKGSIFELSSKPNPLTPFRGFNKEINFMSKQGYRITSDGKQLMYGN